MAVYRKSGGSNVAPSTVKRRSGSSWVNVQTIKRRSGSTWVTVWTAYVALSATIDKTSLTANTHGTGNITIGTAKLTPSNGNGSNTFSVARVSGSAEITANMAQTGFATFKRNISDPAATQVSAVFRLTVSDGVSSAFQDCTVTTTDLL